MVYFAGENHLADDMVYALKEMKSVGSNDNLTLLAQYSAKWVEKSQSSSTRPATPLWFYLKNDGQHPKQWVMSNYIPPNESTRKPKDYIGELADFIAWGVQYKQSDRYMVVLSGDGGGPLTTFLPSSSQPTKALKPRELAKVFECVNEKLGENKIFDVVGLDSCLMSMAETAYEIREHASYLISSEGSEDDMGWPYRDILQTLKDNATWDSLQVVQSVVDNYNMYYVDYAMLAGTSASLSALNLDNVDFLADAVKGFTDAANDILPRSGEPPKDVSEAERFARVLIRAHWVAQSYRQDQYTDLYDFCMILGKEIEQLDPQLLSAKLRRVQRACVGVMKVLCSSEKCDQYSKDTVIVKSCYVGVESQYSLGLSLYFPWHRIKDAYFPDRANSRPGGSEELL